MVRKFSIGDIINNYKILDYSTKKASYLCVCQGCDRESYKTSSELSNPNKKCYFCRTRDDKIGRQLGCCTIIGLAENKKDYMCQCTCGNVFIFKKGNSHKFFHCCSKCKNQYLSKQKIAQNHGETNSRLWNSWFSMRQRCNYPKNIGYKNYGGRGIKVCDEWNNSYIKFREWALANGYADHLTIDRIDNNGNYEPSNCRWSTRTEQQRNRRNTTMVTYNGETKPLQEWSEIYNIDAERFRQRLTSGWSVERIVSTPPQNNKNKLKKCEE